MDELIVQIKKLRDKLKEEYSIHRSDGKPMELHEVLSFDVIFNKIDIELDKIEK